MYGETRRSIRPPRCSGGLSPHVRGNRRRAPRRDRRPGSIPACTGKPCRPRGRLCPAWVYPRMYGETSATDGSTSWTAGLSPHVRGNSSATGPRRPAARSIPACTGKPRRRQRPGGSRRVYPRMYGETPVGELWYEVARGLSPHVRGNLGRLPGVSGEARSIPACTGKPRRRRVFRHHRQVYPRMYGETVPRLRRAVRPRGLSPHVRGNRRTELDRIPYLRSIPACTGKPSVGALFLVLVRVYPRMYGETIAYRRAPDVLKGLSPHVRGNRE